MIGNSALVDSILSFIAVAFVTYITNGKLVPG